jgi:hypothetical protein
MLDHDSPRYAASDDRFAGDEGTDAGAARRLLVVRLREEIALRESAQPSDPRIEEARRELRALTRGR